MQSDRRNDGLGEKPGQPFRSEPLMDVIDAAIGSVIRKPVEEMTDIVNQGRDDQRSPGTGSFRQASRLAGMLPLADRFAAVFRMSMRGEQVAERVVGARHVPGALLGAGRSSSDPHETSWTSATTVLQNALQESVEDRNACPLSDA
jgi:hypothetical protein